VDLGIEFVHRDPIAQIAVQAISFLNEDEEATLMLPGEGDHVAERGATGLLRSFDVNELLGNSELSAGSVRSQQIELRRNREAFALLILRGNAGVNNGGAEHGIWIEDTVSAVVEQKSHFFLPTIRPSNTGSGWVDLPALD
jgi:hypothetical protein